MSAERNLTKAQLLKVIDELRKHPEDRVRILGDAGITAMGLGLGAAAAGTVATIAGATSIPFLTTAASWVGVTAVAATPVGWVLGAAIAGGLAAYGISRLVHNGAISEGRKGELLQAYQDRLAEVLRRERADEVGAPDRNKFIVSLRELVEKDVIDPAHAFRLIEAIEKGAMPLSQAYKLVSSLLEEQKVQTK